MNYKSWRYASACVCHRIKKWVVKDVNSQVIKYCDFVTKNVHIHFPLYLFLCFDVAGSVCVQHIEVSGCYVSEQKRGQILTLSLCAINNLNQLDNKLHCPSMSGRLKWLQLVNLVGTKKINCIFIMIFKTAEDEHLFPTVNWNKNTNTTKTEWGFFEIQYTNNDTDTNNFFSFRFLLLKSVPDSVEITALVLNCWIKYQTGYHHSWLA